MTESKINLNSKLESIKDYWSPKVIAELNDYQFKLAKIKDEFIWHEHNDTDEAFIVIKGNIEIQLENKTVELSEGEMFVVPKGAKHKPIARGEAHIMLIEPRDVKNTGNIENELTARNDIWI
tara:strand:+ start:150 stop:515 length:366 start_codon:yes stop_codon:yes gene_type:complete